MPKEMMHTVRGSLWFLIIIAEAIRKRVLMKSLMSHINNHPLIKIISQELYIEEHDLLTILCTIFEDVFHLITK